MDHIFSPYAFGLNSDTSRFRRAQHAQHPCASVTNRTFKGRFEKRTHNLMRKNDFYLNTSDLELHNEVR